MSSETKELYWEHRLRAREWVKQVRRDPEAALGSTNVLWTLEELKEKMCESTRATTLTLHAFGRLMRRAGFAKIAGLRTDDGQRVFWILRPGMQMTYGNAKTLYDEERSGRL